MTKSLFCLPTAEVKLPEAPAFLTGDPIDWEETVRQVGSPTQGGVVVFSGCVRDSEDGHPIRAIHYAAYLKMAEQEIAAIISETERSLGVKAVVRHRIGRVPIGEASLLVACSDAHRKKAFEACQWMVDQIKSRVPIWKVGFET